MAKLVIVTRDGGVYEVVDDLDRYDLDDADDKPLPASSLIYEIKRVYDSICWEFR